MLDVILYVVGCFIWYLCPLYLLYKVVNIVGKNWQEQLSLLGVSLVVIVSARGVH